ncbi:hypothetical protein CCUS01_13513 [Colletotrichum cuscutae]|uniref:N-acetyltransferase domain-containing protein n=1 Tax=Colletotrichum cuscutae TaxID=1209917 RepID=A0AAJ0DNH1_9PEZI|nr:hypothetical protein CCUS01_13513 [Colletotrichum cuscutae]
MSREGVSPIPVACPRLSADYVSCAVGSEVGVCPVGGLAREDPQRLGVSPPPGVLGGFPPPSASPFVEFQNVISRRSGNHSFPFDSHRVSHVTPVTRVHFANDVGLLTSHGRSLSAGTGHHRRRRTRARRRCPALYLTFLCTDYRFRGRGAGKALIHAATEAARAEGLPVFLESTTDAVPFYGNLPGGAPSAEGAKIYEETLMILENTQDSSKTSKYDWPLHSCRTDILSCRKDGPTSVPKTIPIGSRSSGRDILTYNDQQWRAEGGKPSINTQSHTLFCKSVNYAQSAFTHAVSNVAVDRAVKLVQRDILFQSVDAAFLLLVTELPQLCVFHVKNDRGETTRISRCGRGDFGYIFTGQDSPLGSNRQSSIQFIPAIEPPGWHRETSGNRNSMTGTFKPPPPRGMRGGRKARRREEESIKLLSFKSTRAFGGLFRQVNRRVLSGSELFGDDHDIRSWWCVGFSLALIPQMAVSFVPRQPNRDDDSQETNCPATPRYQELRLVHGPPDVDFGLFEEVSKFFDAVEGALQARMVFRIDSSYLACRREETSSRPAAWRLESMEPVTKRAGWVERTLKRNGGTAVIRGGTRQPVICVIVMIWIRVMAWAGPLDGWLGAKREEQLPDSRMRDDAVDGGPLVDVAGSPEPGCLRLDIWLRTAMPVEEEVEVGTMGQRDLGQLRYGYCRARPETGGTGLSIRALHSSLQVYAGRNVQAASELQNGSIPPTRISLESLEFLTFHTLGTLRSLGRHVPSNLAIYAMELKLEETPRAPKDKMKYMSRDLPICHYVFLDKAAPISPPKCLVLYLSVPPSTPSLPFPHAIPSNDDPVIVPDRAEGSTKFSFKVPIRPPGFGESSIPISLSTFLLFTRNATKTALAAFLASRLQAHFPATIQIPGGLYGTYCVEARPVLHRTLVSSLSDRSLGHFLIVHPTSISLTTLSYLLRPLVYLTIHRRIDARLVVRFLASRKVIHSSVIGWSLAWLCSITDPTLKPPAPGPTYPVLFMFFPFALFLDFGSLAGISRSLSCSSH